MYISVALLCECGKRLSVYASIRERGGEVGQLQHRVGLILHINQQTATLDCDRQTWRMAFGLLRHVVNA
jgi:hypothetical protein